MIWFTGDTHAYHTRCIDYSNRPFSDGEEMAECLAKNINELVGVKDILYHLGDFAFYNKAAEFRAMINCQDIRLIYGSHDKNIIKNPGNLFTWVRKYHEEKNIILFHNPIEIWERKHYGTIHLHAHCHGGLGRQSGINRFDAGVDCWDYKPFNEEMLNE